MRYIFLLFIVFYSCKSEINLTKLGDRPILNEENNNQVEDLGNINQVVASPENSSISWSYYGQSYVDIELYNSSAYVLKKTPIAQSLVMFDMTLANPIEVDFFNIPGVSIIDFEIRRNSSTLFILLSNNRIRSYDLSIHMSPVFLGELELTTVSPLRIQTTAQSELMLVEHTLNNYSFVDIALPDALSVIAEHNLNVNINGVLSPQGDKILYVSSSNEIESYDLSSLPMPPIFDGVSAAVAGSFLFYLKAVPNTSDGNRLYVSKNQNFSQGGFEVFDIYPDIQTLGDIYLPTTSPLEFFISDIGVVDGFEEIIFFDPGDNSFYNANLDPSRAPMGNFLGPFMGDNLSIGENAIKLVSSEGFSDVVALTETRILRISRSDLSIVSSVNLANNSVSTYEKLHIIAGENNLFMMSNTSFDSLDLSQESSINIDNQIGSLMGRGNFITTSFDGDLLFLGGGASYGVQIFNNENRDNPVEVGTIGYELKDLVVNRTADVGFGLTYNSLIRKFNLSNLSSIESYDSLALSSTGVELELSLNEQKAFALSLNSFSIIDARGTPDAFLSEIKSYSTALTNANSFDVSNDETLAVIATNDQGIMVLDIESTPINLLSTIDPNLSGAKNVLLLKDLNVLLFSVSATNSLYAYDLSTPSSPILLDQFQVAAPIKEMVRYDQSLIVYVDGEGLLIFDISDPSNLSLML